MTASADISSDKVMTLRRKTGAGIMDCKRAIQESAGDLDKAVEILRKKGLADLAKRAGRAMKEGTIAVKVSDDGSSASIVELNSETDFVAKNPEFKALAEGLASALLQNPSMSDPANDASMKETVQKLAAKMGENMQLRRGARYQLSGSGVLNYYVHTDTKKAALVELGFQGDASKTADELKSIAKEVALQSVAMFPRWVRREDVPAEVIEKEKEIYRANAIGQGKPAAAVEKMLEGRIKKFFQESCLLEQASIRDSKMTVSAMLEQASSKLGGKITVKRFENYHVGME